MSASELQMHWEAAYEDGDAAKSWTQHRPAPSLSAIAAALGDNKDAAIIDVGGGSSSLAAELLAAGYSDVSVLDISTRAMRLVRERMAQSAARIHWIAADLLDWRPDRQYALWHDRAVLHFFVTDFDRERYANVARAAIARGGYAVIATFAPDGPTTCSGLPVHRSSAQELEELLGAAFTPVRAERELHRTPSGAEQPFTWASFRRA